MFCCPRYENVKKVIEAKIYKRKHDFLCNVLR